MKPNTTRINFIFIFTMTVLSGSSQNAFFKDAPESSFGIAGQKRMIIPSKYRTLILNKTALENFLKNIPSENATLNRNKVPVIEIPMPGGGLAKFYIWESSVMDPTLAVKFPAFKTFTGQGIDDPTANIKLDWTQFGFHAMIISSVNGGVFIDPYTQSNTTDYISYYRKDFFKGGEYVELPLQKTIAYASRPTSPGGVLAGLCIGTQLRTYRLALAASGEYTAFHGGTIAGALAAQVTTMNRVNGVYERELSIRMVLVAKNNLLISTDSINDPYTNKDPTLLLDENQANVDAVIGSGNYDIGHVFTTGGGGAARIGVVCIAGEKARGESGTLAPIGDPYDIDYVSHEMGHQFGANHSFNSQTSACGRGTASFTTNAEPGSGSTIMAYAGICGSDDLQPHTDAQFHAISLVEITEYIINSSGNNCAVITSTGNIPPVVNAGANYTIPKSTPFVLSGSGTDANGDALTFSWEQIDVGGPFGSWNNPSGDAPIFRSFVPTATQGRYFPKLSDVITRTTTKGEILPSYARILNFRLTARDNRAGGGGVCFAETAITVDGTAGPFVVTSPNTDSLTWLVGDLKTITWNPAGTMAAPVNCSNVKIELSTDGGLSFPITLADNIPNDGSQEIQVPDQVTGSARVRVMSIGNVFYDMSNFNFTIRNQKVAAPTVVAFPNPFSNKVRFSIESPVSGNASLDVYTVLGQKLQSAYKGYLFAERKQVIDYNSPSTYSGCLIYILRVDNKQVGGKVIQIN